MKIKEKYVIAVLFFLFGLTVMKAVQLVLIENIKTTHIETEAMYTPLEMVKEIEEEIDDDHFFAKPMAIAAAADGSFFVYDMLLTKILKFDKDYKLEKVFLNQGQGPSEIQKKTGGINKIYVTRNGLLTVAAPYNKKIVVFDGKGDFVKDIRMPYSGLVFFSPVMDEKGNIYTISEQNPGIDVLNKNGKLQYSLLSNEDYRHYLIHKPEFDKRILERGTGMESSQINTIYDVLSDNRLLIYIKNASTVYLYKGKELKSKFHIWPEKAMEGYQASLKRLVEKFKAKNFEKYMFDRFFVDKDNENYFYLNGLFAERKGKKVGLIYKFDLKGKLIDLYYADRQVHFLAKRNNLFYGLFRGSVFIYKLK